MSNFKIFKEIKIGGLDKERLLQKLDEANILFNDYAKILIEHEKFLPSKDVQKVNLVKVRLSDIDLNENCTFASFREAAQKHGLEFCPLYLAAFLRLEYLDQNEGPYLTIASERPETKEDFPNGFYLRNVDGGLWLRGYKADGFDNWPAENEFIFIGKN